jgi:hypothetical protein
MSDATGRPRYWVCCRALGSACVANQSRDEGPVAADDLAGTDHQVDFAGTRVGDVHDEGPAGRTPCRRSDAVAVNGRGSH